MTEPLIAAELLAILRCPVCRSEVVERTEPPSLVCVSCGLAYPVRDGVPIMLEESAVSEDG